MIQTIGFTQFCDAFRGMGRNEQFSYEGKRFLFNYLEENYAVNIQKALEYYSLDCIEDLEDTTTVLRVNHDTIIYQRY